MVIGMRVAEKDEPSLVTDNCVVIAHILKGESSMHVEMWDKAIERCISDAKENSIRSLRQYFRSSNDDEWCMFLVEVAKKAKAQRRMSSALAEALVRIFAETKDADSRFDSLIAYFELDESSLADLNYNIAQMFDRDSDSMFRARHYLISANVYLRLEQHEKWLKSFIKYYCELCLQEEYGVTSVDDLVSGILEKHLGILKGLGEDFMREFFMQVLERWSAYPWRIRSYRIVRNDVLWGAFCDAALKAIRSGIIEKAKLKHWELNDFEFGMKQNPKKTLELARELEFDSWTLSRLENENPR